MTREQRNNLPEAHSAAMARIAELEAENEDLKGANLPLYSDRIKNLESRIAALEAELREWRDDAPHDPDCHSVRMRHLPGVFEGAGCPDSHWTNGPCDCWKAALARIPEAKP